MKGRIFIIALAAASLLSFNAFAGSANKSSISQSGYGNLAAIGQVASHHGTNSSSISQKGVHNFAITGQIATRGASNSSKVSQSGAGNVAVTVQFAR
jgi:hypothetical protein